MYSARINNRLPQVYRVCRPAACGAARNLSLMPRYVGNDFTPIFRLMDEFTNQLTTRSPFDTPAFTTSTVRSFNPRFDVKETNDAYELVGELPGIDQKDINIEFTDAQTLSIKGRTETHREEGTRPSAKAVEAQPEQASALSAAETAAEVESIDGSISETSSYHQPTVEDEDGTVSTARPTATPATTEAAPSEAPQQQQVAQPEPQAQNSSHYWISERSVGQFHRSFAFPSRIDQDNVHASLKDGILSIVVPKATLPANRRINIQ